MGAGDTIFGCRGATQGGALTGVTHGRVSPNTVYKVNQGAAGSPGPADAVITDKDVVVELYGTNYAALLARIGVAAATLVINTYGAAGVSEAITITAVVFAEIINPVDIPEKDSGGKLAPFGIRGYANFGAAEGFGDVISAA